MARRYIDQVMKAAILEELRLGVQGRELSKKYGISESTISRWRKAEGIDDMPYANAIVRSRPIKGDNPASTQSEEPSADRRKMLEQMISLVTDLATGGGLKSSDIKNLSVASKALSEAHQREERLLEQEQARAEHVSGSKGFSATSLDALIGLDARGLPRNLETHFTVLDVQDALERKGEEEVRTAWERMVEVFGRYGHQVTEDVFEKMAAKINEDFAKTMEREERQRERQRELLRRQKPESLETAEEYQGEGGS